MVSGGWKGRSRGKFLGPDGLTRRPDNTALSEVCGITDTLSAIPVLTLVERANTMNTTYNDRSRSGRVASAMIRPAWTPATIAMMIIGFMIFWPLGLAMIAYILWGDRLEEFKSGVNRRTDGFAKGWSRDCGSFRKSHAGTGNVAFDEWRDAEIERLREERRKLEEMRAEFDDHLRELRRAKDKEEFDAFMKSYKAGLKSDDDDAPKKPKKKSVPDV